MPSTTTALTNRLDATFSALAQKKQKAFVAYVSGGDPTPAKSLEIIRGLADAGADVIELGVPFSDPLADGIVNQLAADRALKAGTTVHTILDLIRDFRTTHQTPIVLFTYLNPIYTYGFEQFHTDAAAAGADGILLLDLPHDEALKNAELINASGLHNIRLIAPNTPEERRGLIAKSASGFIYALSRTGVTGSHSTPSESIGAEVAGLKAHTDTPICIGFGIDTPEKAKIAAEQSDGIIVGSAIVNQIAENAHAENLAQLVTDFASPLIQAIK